MRFKSTRRQHRVWSQFGSPEALAPEEGKNLGSLIVEILFYSPESNLSIQRRRDSLPSSGEYRASGIGETFWSQWR